MEHPPTQARKPSLGGWGAGGGVYSRESSPPCPMLPLHPTSPCLLPSPHPLPLQWGQVLVSHWLFSPASHREPSELQGLEALEATAWALRMAEHELGITPVLSAKAVVTGSDPLGLIAYLSHFHSAFKSMPHNPGSLEGRWVGRGWGRHPPRDS